MLIAARIQGRGFQSAIVFFAAVKKFSFPRISPTKNAARTTPVRHLCPRDNINSTDSHHLLKIEQSPKPSKAIKTRHEIDTHFAWTKASLPEWILVDISFQPGPLVGLHPSPPR